MADITGDMHTRNLSDPPGGYGYVYYPGTELSAIDLREEMYAEREQGGEVETARIAWVDEETGRLRTNNETAEALYVPRTGRIGIAWGADADWADAESLTEGIRAYCQDTQWEDLRDIAERAAGLRYDSAEAQTIHGEGDWTQYYPETDGYGFLTGRVIDATDDGYLVLEDVAMVEARTLSHEELRLVDEGWFPVWKEAN